MTTAFLVKDITINNNFIQSKKKTKQNKTEMRRKVKKHTEAYKLISKVL